MTHSEALEDYVRRLNTHDWDQIEPVLTDDVVMIFTEGTFVGKQQAQRSIEKTHQLIKEEVFSTSNVTWSVQAGTVAVCHYDFQWRGVIGGTESQGGGRGTSVLIKRDDTWLVAHEHLGPPARVG